MAEPDDRTDGQRSGIDITPRRLVGAALAAALALLIAQNTSDTKVEWLTFETVQPLWVVLLVTAAATLVIAELVGGARRRRKRRAAKE